MQPWTLPRAPFDQGRIKVGLMDYVIINFGTTHNSRMLDIS
jgi:hypothetical protein